MTISENGLALIKRFEGCRLVAYRDTGGVWTIGWGHTSSAGRPNVSPGMALTQAQADAILVADLRHYEAAVAAHVRVALNQNQFDALVSFTYNVGPGNFERSTLLRDLNAGRYAAAKAQFAVWDVAGGRVLAGLKSRRAAEAALFGTPVSAPAETQSDPAPASGPAPSPAGAPSSPVVGKPSDTAADPSKGNSTMESTIFAGLLKTVGSFALGAKAMSGVAPNVIGGAVKSVPDDEKSFADFEKLVGDVEGGKWGSVIADVGPILGDAVKILGDFGVDIPLLGEVAKSTAGFSTTPSVAGLTAVAA